jgi:hypothetical protein
MPKNAHVDCLITTHKSELDEFKAVFTKVTQIIINYIANTPTNNYGINI